MALAADFFLGSLEAHFSVESRSSRQRGSARLARLGLLVTAVVVASVTDRDLLGSRRPAANQGTGRPIVVASKDFTESALLAEIVGQLLEARKVPVERQFELAATCLTKA